MRILLLSLVVATSAWADGLCGLTARVCRSAETRAQSRHKVPPGEWYLDQEWSPWSVSVDPGDKTMELRFQFGGHADNQGGIAYADTDEQSLHHDIQSCTGSVASGKIELEVGGASPVELIFENGKLVHVRDAAARARSGYDVQMIARQEHLEDALDEWEKTPRNVTFACPGGGQSVFGVAPSGAGKSSSGTSSSGSKSKASGSSSSSGYVKAPASPAAQSRQTDTGEQGGAGGASKVDFGPEVHQASVERCKERCKDGWKDCHDGKHDDYMDCLKAQPYEADSYTICTRQAYGECDDERDSCSSKCESQ